MLRVIKQKEKNQEIVCSVITVGQNKSHHGEKIVFKLEPDDRD